MVEIEHQSAVDEMSIQSLRRREPLVRREL
jgi:hypothetical protein